MPERQIGRVVIGSLAAGHAAALALIVGPVAGAQEHVITGTVLVASGASWAMLANLSALWTDQPQRWAAVPAALFYSTFRRISALLPSLARLGVGRLFLPIVRCLRQHARSSISPCVAAAMPQPARRVRRIIAVMPEPERGLREAVRVLKPGRRIAVFDKFLSDQERPSLKRQFQNILGLTDIVRILWTSIAGGKKVKGGVAMENPERMNFIAELAAAGELKPVIDSHSGAFLAFRLALTMWRPSLGIRHCAHRRHARRPFVVLSVNSLVTIQRDIANPPGELPIWGLLTISRRLSRVLMFANVRSDGSGFEHGE